MKEIGGYFGLDEFAGKEKYADLIHLNCARSSLLYILRAREIRKLWLPYFLCGCVHEMCERFGYEIGYYHIGEDFLPEVGFEPGEGTVYLVNYYGIYTPETMQSLKARFNGKIILDHVQAFFSLPPDGIDTLYSCRKYFGVPDGAYLSTEVNLKEKFGTESSLNRMRHLIGRYEGTASGFYCDFKSNDDSFEKSELLGMSPVSRNIMKAIDYDAVCHRRNSNAAVLNRVLGEKNNISIRHADGPYAYPFYIENGPKIRQALAMQKIYIPTLWPDLQTGASEWEQQMAENILPLPCDQRYTEEDMETILEKLGEYL